MIRTYALAAVLAATLAFGLAWIHERDERIAAETTAAIAEEEFARAVANVTELEARIRVDDARRDSVEAELRGRADELEADAETWARRLESARSSVDSVLVTVPETIRVRIAPALETQAIAADNSLQVCESRLSVCGSDVELWRDRFRDSEELATSQAVALRRAEASARSARRAASASDDGYGLIDFAIDAGLAIGGYVAGSRRPRDPPPSKRGPDREGTKDAPGSLPGRRRVWNRHRRAKSRL